MTGGGGAGFMSELKLRPPKERRGIHPAGNAGWGGGPHFANPSYGGASRRTSSEMFLNARAKGRAREKAGSPSFGGQAAFGMMGGGGAGFMSELELRPPKERRGIHPAGNAGWGGGPPPRLPHSSG